MNRRFYRKTKPSKIKESIFAHIENNLREYIIVTIIFLIGIIIGVIFINNVSDEKSFEINNYISTFIQDLKKSNNINNLELLKESVKKNCILVLVLWILGSTVVCYFLVYIVICFRGFCLGYTISAIILTLRTSEKVVCLYFAMLYYQI